MCSDLTCPVLVWHSWFCLVEASLVLLLLNLFSSTVHLFWFAALASPRLVLVVRKVFLMLHAQSLCLLNEGTLFGFRKEPERERRCRASSVQGLIKLRQKHAT